MGVTYHLSSSALRTVQSAGTSAAAAVSESDMSAVAVLLLGVSGACPFLFLSSAYGPRATERERERQLRGSS